MDLYYPIFMTFRFLFVFGWLRVAETLYNPFGEDDDDFELNELLNRHFKVGDAVYIVQVVMTIVDDHLCWLFSMVWMVWLVMLHLFRWP